MAFRVNVLIPSCEFRRRVTRTADDGKVYRSIRVEDAEGNNIEISVRDDALWSDCDELKKGDMVTLTVRACATDKYNFLQLVGSPELVDGEVGF